MYRLCQRTNNLIERKTIATFLCVLCVVGASQCWASAASIHEQIQPDEPLSLTAVLRRYYGDAPAVFTESWVSMSTTGMRVLDLQTEFEIIKNFTSNQVWMISRKYKTQHEIDINVFRERFPNLVNYVIGPQTKSNILGHEPCIAKIGSLSSDRVWRGRTVEAWSCAESSGVVVSEQLYSRKLGIVVRVQFPDGAVVELIDIKQQELDETVFAVDSTFKNVSFNEFFGERKRLDIYGNGKGGG